MQDIVDAMRARDRRIVDDTRASVDNSHDRKIEPLANGDRFIHNCSTGYVVDGVTGQVKSWSVRSGPIGGPSTWRNASFRHNGVIGPGGEYGLFEEPPRFYAGLIV